MKNKLVLVLVFTMVQAYGQKKKKQDPKDLQIDSLTNAYSALSAQLDSVS